MHPRPLCPFGFMGVRMGHKSEAMSKGLGKMQREILDSLQPSKDLLYYSGAGFYGGQRGWVNYKSCSVLLPENTFDLRALLLYMAKEKGELYGAGYVKPSFQSSFSRSVKRLVESGHLEAPTMLLIEQYKMKGQKDMTGSLIHHLADGLFLMVDKRQVRFVVSVMDNRKNLTNL